MKCPRYLKDYSDISFEKRYTDFLIIGTGIAGLYSAINAHQRGDVMIVTKEKVEDSNTEYAQGGIAAVFDKSDSTELHLEDTLVAGAGLCNRNAVDILVNQGPDRVKDLIAMGTNFDRSQDEDDIALTKEGAHSRRRVLHAGGDATGEEVRRSLTNTVVNKLGIPVHEKTFILDLITHNGRCYGALAYCHHYDKFIAYLAPITIIATGGAGMLYRSTSNPEIATGDGMSFAYRAGAEMMDMEFIQFHPTTLYLPDTPAFLISEAVRGEGAYLRNANGERYMLKHHKMAELAPRDVVARANFKQMEKDGKPHVWLDITHKDPEFVKERFPTIYNTCLEHGIDMTKELIPVAPAAHYIMGGIKIDLNGSTRVPGLYACGEVACTGVHGANRLASNSLLDGLVFGHRIFENVNKEFESFDEKLEEIPLYSPVTKKEYQSEESFSDDYLEELRNLMSDKVGIIRNQTGLEEALETVEDWMQYLDYEFTDMEDWETQNLLILAFVVISSALKRKESRGAHYRKDYPDKDSQYKDWHFIFRRESQRSDYIELES